LAGRLDVASCADEPQAAIPGRLTTPNRPSTRLLHGAQGQLQSKKYKEKDKGEENQKKENRIEKNAEN